MPVLALNSGRMWPNRPESWVEVVEETTIDLSCARAAERRPRARQGGGTMRSARRRSACMTILLSAGDVSGSVKPAVRRRRTGAASAVFGVAERTLGGVAVSTTRPRCISTISPASRRASPRSCVDITTLMPRAATSRTTSSIALVAAGSRLAVGSSRNSTCGSLASARASASRCCSPPDSRRAGRSPRPVEPDQRQQFVDARGAFGARHAGGRQRVARCWPRRCAAASPGAGTRWRGASGGDVLAAAPGDAAGGRLDQAHGERAAAWSCRRRSARSGRSARRRASASEMRSRIVTPRTTND